MIQSFRLDGYNNTPTFTKDYYFDLHPTFARRLINKFNKVIQVNKIQITSAGHSRCWDGLSCLSLLH